MSSIAAELGNVEYIFLRNVDCNGGVGGAGGGTFEWFLPILPQRESSIIYLQIAQLTLHYEGTGVDGSPEPQYLVYNNLFSENMYSSDKSAVLASILSRDDATGHYETQSDSPIIQVSSNLIKINLSLRDSADNSLNNIGTTGSISMLLKIIRPKLNVNRDNILKSYVQSQIGNIRI
jgi:hypothetical protein